MLHQRLRLVLISMLIVGASACGGGGNGAGPSSPTSPSSPSAPAVDPSCPPTSSNCGPATTLAVTIRVGVAPGTSWSFEVGGLTVSGAGSQATRILGLTPGIVEVSGQLPANLGFHVGIPPSNAGGSVPLGSVQSVEGPLSSSTDCSVEYTRPGNNPVRFRFRFTLNAAGSATGCRL